MDKTFINLPMNHCLFVMVNDVKDQFEMHELQKLVVSLVKNFFYKIFQSARKNSSMTVLSKQI